LVADAEATLARLLAEQAALSREAEASAARRSGVEERVGAAEGALTETEKTFSEITAALADLSAQRNLLESTMREHSERRVRIQQEIAGVEAELQKLESDASMDVALRDLAAKVSAAQQAVADAETAGVRAEAAQSAARQALDGAREPLAEAE